MSEKPEALLVADRLDLWGDQGDLLEAAAELRRQYGEIIELKAKAETWLLSPEAAQRLDGYRELSQRAWRAEIDLTATEAELREVSDRAFKAEAERDALRAELDRLTTLRPAMEWHDDEALWWGRDGNTWLCDPLFIPSTHWTPLPKVKEPK